MSIRCLIIHTQYFYENIYNLIGHKRERFWKSLWKEEILLKSLNVLLLKKVDSEMASLGIALTLVHGLG